MNHLRDYIAQYSPFELFRLLPQAEGTILLESVSSNAEHGNYSVIVLNPYATVRSINGRTFVLQNGKGSLETKDTFEVLRKFLAGHQKRIASELPFTNGAVGYVSYDYGMRSEHISSRHPKTNSFPEFFFGLYNWSLCYRHQTKEWSINGNEEEIAFLENLIHNTNITTISQEPITHYLISDVTKKEYVDLVNRVKGYISRGDCYQVNLSHRFWGKTTSSALTIYNSLRKHNPAPFSSLLYLDEKKAVLSSSPELFLSLEGNNIETRPIKGTIHRGANDEADEELKRSLLKSEKDGAELLMIVDLERNDLNKICEKSSVKVSSMKHIESYETVHHLVSIVQGTLREDCDAIDALQALFPGGSITGAPKIRAMEIIDEMEKGKRGIYTGAIGWIDGRGNAKFNIAIRTLMQEQENIWFNVGGGIVADSDPEKEYEETLHKADGMLRALHVNFKG